MRHLSCHYGVFSASATADFERHKGPTSGWLASCRGIPTTMSPSIAFLILRARRLDGFYEYMGSAEVEFQKHDTLKLLVEIAWENIVAWQGLPRSSTPLPMRIYAVHPVLYCSGSALICFIHSFLSEYSLKNSMICRILSRRRRSSTFLPQVI